MRSGCSTPTPGPSSVGVLPAGGQARLTPPASVVGRYQAIDVSLEADDGDPTHSKRSLLRGRYA
jgi:anti-sigma-K factor RskA